MESLFDSECMSLLFPSTQNLQTKDEYAKMNMPTFWVPLVNLSFVNCLAFLRSKSVRSKSVLQIKTKDLNGLEVGKESIHGFTYMGQYGGVIQNRL